MNPTIMNFGTQQRLNWQSSTEPRTTAEVLARLLPGLHRISNERAQTAEQREAGARRIAAHWRRR